MDKLAQIAKDLVVPQKGVFAADWSEGSAKKQFEKNGFDSTEESRRLYRQMLLSTQGYEKYISGIILHPETAKQKNDEEISFPKYISSRGMLPGVRADEGYEKFGDSGEQITKGIKTLDNRLKEYKKLGLKFTKWRAPFLIDGVRPSDEVLYKNTEYLIKFAYLSQKNGLVPIVEPEVLLDGDHTNAKCEEVATFVLKSLFAKLLDEKVDLEALVLKTNMILPGKESGVKANPKEVAHATVRTMKNSVPGKVPGIVFLSGGQTYLESTANLQEISVVGSDVPWELSFSYARALQYPAIEVYGGKKENIKKAQEVFLYRAKMNSLARQGKYDAKMK